MNNMGFSMRFELLNHFNDVMRTRFMQSSEWFLKKVIAFKCPFEGRHVNQLSGLLTCLPFDS